LTATKFQNSEFLEKKYLFFIFYLGLFGENYSQGQIFVSENFLVPGLFMLNTWTIVSLNIDAHFNE